MTKIAFAWFGGKTMMRKWILNNFPPHNDYQTYVEVFGGSGAILLAKQPSPVEVYNDVNRSLINFFRVLRDKDKVEELKRLCNLTLYSREEYENWRHYHDDSQSAEFKDASGDVDAAHKWFYVIRSTFSGTRAWGYSIKTSSRGKSGKVAAWHTGIERLDSVAKRFMNVQVEQLDYHELVKKYDHDKCLFYADPPYVKETRSKSMSEYEHELNTVEEHTELVDLFLSIKGMAIISGYDHEVYQPLLDAGWRVEKKEVRSTASNTGAVDKETGRPKRVECLWISPNIKKQNQGKLF